jgi:hypothetical protein
MMGAAMGAALARHDRRFACARMSFAPVLDEASRPWLPMPGPWVFVIVFCRWTVQASVLAADPSMHKK